MPGLDPISPYLALIDRLISLIQAGKTRRKDYFEKIIDPLYTEFVPAGEDMLALFRAARTGVKTFEKRHKIKTNKGDLMPPWTSKQRREILIEMQADFKAIQLQREKFVDARNRLKGLLAACEENLKRKDEADLGAFVSSMIQFFNPAGQYGQSVGLVLVNLFRDQIVDIDRTKQPGSDRYVSSLDQLAEIISSMTDRLETDWFVIAGRYMELKLKNTVD
jgi:hypothetical protein